MKEYKSDKLRNVGIVAHGGAGKTSLTEAMLFNSGAVNRLGRVDDGSATTDFEPEEVKRKVTISTALAPCEWRDYKINFVDTPGYADFVAEVKGALRAVDSALIVLCAAAGVEVETEKVWKYASELGMPRIGFINKMDRENADFYSVVESMKEKFGNGVVPVQLPIGAEDNFKGIVNILNMKAYLPDKTGKEYTQADIPADMSDKAEEARMALIEAAAEGNDELLTKYLEGEELSDDEIKNGLLAGIAQAKVFPVFCGSALKNIGVKQVLDSIVTYLPASDATSVLGYHPVSNDPVERNSTDPFSAMVFKTTADPFVGRLSYIRLFSGSMKPDTTLYNATKQKAERIGTIFTLKGKHQDPITNANAGDIVVVAKLQETATGDSLCDKDNPILFEQIAYPKPMFTRTVEAKNKGDEDKIGQALARLMDEDPTFKVRKDVETHQLLISGMGELHLDIIAERMKRKFGVETLLATPKVPYRETIRGSAKVEGKHKKQSGGHGQYGHVWLQLEPLAPGKDFEFVDSIFGGAVPRQYIPAVEKGVKEALTGGILAGYPMVDVKVTLTDGSYHTVDSSEMAFKIASAMALRKGVLQAKPVLLEPIYSIEVVVPEPYMGDVIGDLNTKRGRIQGMEPIGDGLGKVKAQVPLAEMFRYSIDLRSITQGRGSFDMTFSHYEDVPARIAESIIANAKKDKVEES
ncbi:elongation factor G [Sporomusa acidovorans]|uniref:Elongation factor G n=1 Tax=Sporomusa acidovorans (strain ATCC 49682 / DSM 3132 / Mol) TaxID=1123286 RepID=A0ABZ3J3Y5_SPOA4|nr:elongation factor G [Sporomusa acidovorans]OZC20260.1 elongation factor G [Sporomusa acidovorans DSM 3132]SDD40301.1 elongation factor G [Sporomusa acidovorans]